MSDFNYRFSIIPPGAITDTRVTARALQVLCLLGRHINNGGWCTRSQVKMARELACSRSAVQEACNLLIDTGWVETRRNGRGGTAPESSEQPFSAYSYRVRLDRDDLPAPEAGAESMPADAVETHEGGAAQAAGGAAQAAGGAAQAAPLEGISSEGIFTEAERESRIRDHDEFAKWLSAFLMRWPTAAADDQSRIATAGRNLTKDQRKAATDKIPAFLEHLRKLKRDRVPSGWRYLEDLKWEKLPGDPSAETMAATGGFEEGSTQWKIWHVVFRIARPRSGVPSFKITGSAPHRRLYMPQALPEAMLALNDESLQWDNYADGTPNYAAWWRWLNTLMPANLIERYEVGNALAISAPAPWPPRKNGTLSGSTDPPQSSTG